MTNTASQNQSFFCLDLDDLHFNKTVVIGVGLIGGSLVKAIQRYESEHDISTPILGHIVGVGRGVENLKKAKELGVINEYTHDIAEAAKDADLIIIATPVGAVLDILKTIKPVIKDSCIITDVGSVKSKVIEDARAGLGEKACQFVPAHPIAGTEHSGVEAAFAELYRTRYTIVTPLSENPPLMVEKIYALWAMTYCQLLTMTSAEHDEIFAVTSHLPHVLVYALMNNIAEKANKEQYLQVVAGGFLDYTRIASSDAVMWRDVCLTNKQPILDALSSYQESIEKLKHLIETSDGEQLFNAFVDAKAHRDDLLVSEKKRKNK